MAESNQILAGGCASTNILRLAAFCLHAVVLYLVYLVAIYRYQQG